MTRQECRWCGTLAKENEAVCQSTHEAINCSWMSESERKSLGKPIRQPMTADRAPMPGDPRLLRVCKAILAEPATQADVDDWAKLAGMGRRTFTRAFKRETGMGLAVWRQQVRLMEALSLIGSGQPVTTVAFDVGYDSPSAFSAMFRRAFGVPPSAYAAR